MRKNSVHTGLSTRVIVGISVMVMLMVSACTQEGDREPLTLPGLASTTASGSGEDGARSRLPTAAPRVSESGEEGAGSSGRADGDADGGAGDGGVGSGPGGAPWDPCQIITWDDLPGEMPADEAKAQPEPQSAPADAQHTAACRFRATTNDIVVLWGPSSKATIQPEGKHGEEQTTVAGQPALKIVDLSEALTLVCMYKVDLENGRGVAGVGAFAKTKAPAANDKHPCAVALRLAADVVKRTP